MYTISEPWFEAILWRPAPASMSEELPLPYGNQKYLGFEFMDPHVADMAHGDPAKHPKMDEVVTPIFRDQRQAYCMETTLPDSPPR
ncbi:hypothetical protein BC826DRAFT_317192 [Russula brevipes]|nr:hypothetical protein BC826DRAFT_317192 [Russula brevipes]